MTSPPEEIKVMCPKCHQLFQDWYRASFNFGLGGDFKEEFSDEYLDEASSVKCPTCGWKENIDALKVDLAGIFRVRS